MNVNARSSKKAYSGSVHVTYFLITKGKRLVFVTVILNGEPRKATRHYTIIWGVICHGFIQSVSHI